MTVFSLLLTTDNFGCGRQAALCLSVSICGSPVLLVNNDVAYGQSTLSPGIRSRSVEGINGLTIHTLEAGSTEDDRPVILLLHGFPELAYSWRKVMIPLAAAGYYVIAPDQRGYGLTTGWDGDYDGDLASFRILNIVHDAIGLVFALGRESVSAVVGHDYSSSVAAWSALLRPDVYRSVVMMSAPFGGPPALPFGTADNPSLNESIHDELAALPRQRKHYQRYYTTREANANMRDASQGIHAFLRAYYHYKSADWVENKPHPLEAWTAAELAKLPTYCVMDRDVGIAETVVPHMLGESQIEACAWLTEEELQVYSEEYERNGFQGGLQWYRCGQTPRFLSESQVFAGRTIDVPACFISGASDWGVHQRPGALEAMKSRVCVDYRGTHLIKGAGHWVQQEQSDAVIEHLLAFLA
jgi:pimeloyl-ACP methyl ester carboxylesterase